MTIPESIKRGVISAWLDGISREEIAVNYRISGGLISNIISEARGVIKDLDLMREMALILKKTGYSLDTFAFVIRLHNKLGRMGLDEELAESTMEKLHVHCFTKNIKVSRFLSQIDDLIYLTSRIAVPITDLEKYVFEKIDQIERLKEDVLDKARKRNDMAAIYDTTVPDLEDYKIHRPILEKFRQAQNENEKKDQVIQDQDMQIRDLKEMVEKLNRELYKDDMIS